MKMEEKRRGPPIHCPSMALLAILFCIFLGSSRPVVIVSATATPAFSPRDNHLIDCGADNLATLPDGRIFKTDKQAADYLTYDGEHKFSSQSADDVPSALYTTASAFSKEAIYTFSITSAGWHWIRLHFHAFRHDKISLFEANFTVTADNLVLLRNFGPDSSTPVVVKEYLVNVTTEKLEIKFTPENDKVAFVNAIEVVSAPDYLIEDSASNLIGGGQFGGLSSRSYETVYRLNMGGPLVTSSNDTLGRTWENDENYLNSTLLAKNASVSTSAIKYPDGKSLDRYIAPSLIYATAQQMGDANMASPTFNVTWDFNTTSGFSYLIRLHFCDIVSKSLYQLYFNVFINQQMAVAGLDLSKETMALSTAYYRDIYVDSAVVTEKLKLQIGPNTDKEGDANAIINGVEILKMNNQVNSLDGFIGADGKKAVAGGSSKTVVAAVGLAMMFGTFVGLGAMVIKWQKRPQDWQKRNSFSSWLLPIHAGDTSFMSSKNSLGSQRTSTFFSSTLGLGRFFSFAELQEATKDFDSRAIIGVGGFGNVYLGVIDDGTKVAVKRGNPQSEQGINEFQTELQMLSKLRHRHLVSLIGYCDENSEMILVYEYMSNGPFRDHLYGKNLPQLSWRQRLEICIGAARGLHYLHTGAAQGIIHRDVKTTNILLDDAFVAKVADFGLSKNAPTMEQGHVSTAVKGSFGYLDPEYFRRQQLTDKSDVYSFGVVLLEALCARPAINPALPREQVNLAEWAMMWKRKGLLDKIIDPSLVGTINPESMKKFAEAAEKCLADYGVDRPSMGDVLWNLEYALQLQESSAQGKTEETSTIAVGGPVAPAIPDNSPVASPQETNNSPAQVPVIEDHSGTAMFAQFAALNGR
ncbi:Malectin-like domain [Dillenia turbinata]|uniref:Malectin-like domain n=1 Tax=Dillenia turbinata TaxID=194707 RepID=A0AAN8W6R8_9MAGN